MTYDIGFVLDGLILVFLGVTIFYAARLSLFLKSFREGRDGMRALIRDLSVTIDKAEKSVATMKENAAVTANELQEIINESKFLSDELRFMNETGDGLANRLEKLADRNRDVVGAMESSSNGDKYSQLARALLEPAQAKKQKPVKPRHQSVEDLDDYFEIEDFDIDEDDEQDFQALGDGSYREEDKYMPRVDTTAKSKVRSFAIFDREYSGDLEELDDVVHDREESKFHSRAEQDLYEALQRRKRVSELS